MKFLLSIVDAISEFTGKFYSFLCPVLIGIIVIEVIRRYVFNLPIPGIHDIMTAYFGAYYLMAAAYTHLYGAHVRVDVVHARFSARGKAILDLITLPFFLLFVGVIIYAGWEFAMDSTWIEGRGWLFEFDHSHLHNPLWPIKWTIPIGGFLLLIQGLAKFVRDLYFVVTRKELA